MEPYMEIHGIVLSTIKSAREIAKTRLLGAEDYLVKPVTNHEYVKVATDMKRKTGLLPRHWRGL